MARQASGGGGIEWRNGGSKAINQTWASASRQKKNNKHEESGQ